MRNVLAALIFAASPIVANATESWPTSAKGGRVAFTVYPFSPALHFNEEARLEEVSLILVCEGDGMVTLDVEANSAMKGSLELSLVPITGAASFDDVKQVGIASLPEYNSPTDRTVTIAEVIASGLVFGKLSIEGMPPQSLIWDMRPAPFSFYEERKACGI